jgi:hypothetical protein
VLRALALVALFVLYAVLLLGVRWTLWHDAIVLPLVLYVAVRFGGPRRAVIPFLAGAAIAALALHLLYVWKVGYAGRNHVFAGYFALSDAGGYYADAERVLHGAPMNGGGVRRPIFSAVLAGALRVIGHDIRLAHVITMLFWACAGAFAAGEVWRTHGRRAGALVFVVFVLFARRYVGFVQSEGIGGPVGALAFGLVWRAQSMKTGWSSTYLGGLLLQCIALLGRPGPIFVIVGLVGWAVHRARGLERAERRRLVLQSAGAIVLALLFQHVIRSTTTVAAPYSDLPPILYGLVNGEDSQFVWARHPWLGELPESARSSAIWPLIGRDLLERPWLVVVAPLRCLASWFYLPQGFFGFVWLNPDDRVLENASVVKAAIRDHGYAGPILLWVRELGAYSLLNAGAMAGAALAFVVALLRSAGRAWRARRTAAPAILVPVLGGVLVSLPLLPPWITEGAQILASVFFYVVTFAVTSFLPKGDSAPEVPAIPKLGPALFAALSMLVLFVRLFPTRAPGSACDGEGRYLADVDRRAMVSYGPGTSMLAADTRNNIAILEKNNGAFAHALLPTLDEAHRIFPAYDACHEQMLYVVEPASDSNSVPDARWTWLRSMPLGPSLESMNPRAERRLPR